MVLMGDGGPEERHDAVTEKLVDRALVAVHLGQHEVEGSAHQAVDFLRVDTLGQRSRSEEHTSELQSRSDLVCRLLLEKKKTLRPPGTHTTQTPTLSGESTYRHLPSLPQSSTISRFFHGPSPLYS